MGPGPSPGPSPDMNDVDAALPAEFPRIVPRAARLRKLQYVGNFTCRKNRLRFLDVADFFKVFEHFVVFRKAPQNLRVVFKQRSESPQISAILRKTCANNAEQQLKKNARKISYARVSAGLAKQHGTRRQTCTLGSAIELPH